VSVEHTDKMTLIFLWI